MCVFSPELCVCNIRSVLLTQWTSENCSVKLSMTDPWSLAAVTVGLPFMEDLTHVSSAAWRLDTTSTTTLGGFLMALHASQIRGQSVWMESVWSQDVTWSLDLSSRRTPAWCVEATTQPAFITEVFIKATGRTTDCLGTVRSLWSRPEPHTSEWLITAETI